MAPKSTGVKATGGLGRSSDQGGGQGAQHTSGLKGHPAGATGKLGTAPGLAGAGKLAASQGRPKAGAPQANALSPSGPLDPLNAGHQAYASGDFARAAGLYEQAVRGRLGELDPLVAWGMALQQLGRHEEARKRYAEARRLVPDSGKLAFLEGVQALALGDRPGAREALEACVRLSPEAGPAWFFLGQLRRDAGEGVQAEEAYAKAQKLVPDLPPVATHRGINALERGKLDDALAYASAGAKAQPKDPYAWMVLGAVHAARLEWELSVRAHRKAATEAPALAEPFYRLGQLLYEQKQWDEARECFLQALEREPRHLASLMALGLIEGALGSHETALACFDAAATIRPNWPDVAFWRGVALANLNQGDEAQAAFALAASQAPGNPMISGALAAFAPEGIMDAGESPPEARA